MKPRLKMVKANKVLYSFIFLIHPILNTMASESPKENPSNVGNTSKDLKMKNQEGFIFIYISHTQIAIRFLIHKML